MTTTSTADTTDFSSIALKLLKRTSSEITLTTDTLEIIKNARIHHNEVFDQFDLQITENGVLFNDEKLLKYLAELNKTLKKRFDFPENHFFYKDLVELVDYGYGFFTSVQRVLYTKNLTLFSKKVIETKKSTSQTIVLGELMPIIYLSEISNESLLKVLRSDYVPNEKLEILMECGLGTLQDLIDFLKARGITYPSILYDLKHDLSDQLRILTENDLCHRDIKPENILITKDFHFKLTDYGYCEMVPDHQTQKVTIVGTYKYMHEALQKAFDEDTDCFVDPYLADEYAATKTLLHCKSELESCGLIVEKDKIIQMFEANIIKGCYDKIQDQKKKNDILAYLFEHRKFEDLKVLMKDELKKLDAGNKENISRILFIYDKLGDIAAIDLNLEDAFGYYILGANLIVQHLNEDNIAESCYFLLVKAAKLCIRREKYDQAMKYLNQFKKLMESKGEPSKISLVHDYLAFCHLKIDKIEEACNHLDQELKILEELRLQRDDHSYFRYHRTRGLIEVKQNNYVDAQVNLRKALKLILMESIEDYYEIYEIHYNLFKVFSSEKLLETADSLPNLQDIMSINQVNRVQRTPTSFKRAFLNHEDHLHAVQSILIWALKYGKDFLDSMSMVYGKESQQYADACLQFGAFLLKFSTGFEETTLNILKDALKTYSKLLMEDGTNNPDCYYLLGKAMLNQNPESEDGKKMIQNAFDLKMKSTPSVFECYKDYISASIEHKTFRSEAIKLAISSLSNITSLKAEHLRFFLLSVTELFKDRQYVKNFEDTASKLVFAAIKTFDVYDLLFSEGFLMDLYVNLGFIYSLNQKPEKATEFFNKAFKSLNRGSYSSFIAQFYLDVSDMDRSSFFIQQVMGCLKNIENESEDYLDMYLTILCEEFRRILIYPRRRDYNKRRLCSFLQKPKPSEITEKMLDFYFRSGIYYYECGDHKQTVHYLNLLDLLTLNNINKRHYFLYLKWSILTEDDQKESLENEIMAILNGKALDHISIMNTLEYLCIINILNKDYQRAMEYIHRSLVWIKQQMPGAIKQMIKNLKLASKAYHHNFYDLISDKHMEVIKPLANSYISTGNLEILDNFDTHSMFSFIDVVQLKKGLKSVIKQFNHGNYKMSLYFIFILESKTRGKKEVEDGDVNKTFMDLIGKLELIITNQGFANDAQSFLELFTNIFTANSNAAQKERYEILQSLIGQSSHRFRPWEENVEFFPKEQRLYLLLQNYGRVVITLNRLLSESSPDIIVKIKEKILYGPEVFFTSTMSNIVGCDTELTFIYPERGEEDAPRNPNGHLELDLKYNPKKYQLRDSVVKNLLEYVDPVSLSTATSFRKESEDKLSDSRDQLDLEIVEEENHELTSRTSLGSFNNLDLIPSKTSIESQGKIDSIKNIITAQTTSLEDKALTLEDYNIEIAKEYEWLGLLAIFDRNLQDSLKFLKNSVEIKEAKSTDNPLVIAKSYDILGIVYQIQGQMQLAKEFHEKSLKIKLERSKQNDYELIPTYQLLILACLQLGLGDEVLDYQLKITKLQLNHETIAETRIEIYQKWADMFDLPEVNNLEAILKKVSSRIKDYLDPKMKSFLWDILGFLYSKISLMEAEDCHNNGLVCRRLYQADYHCLISYEYLASVSDQDYIALDWRRKSERLKKKLFGNSHLEVLVESFKMGDILFGIKHFQKAAETYISGLKLLPPGFEPRCLINVYFNIAMCQANQKLHLKAIFYLKKVISLRNSFEYKEETYLREYEYIYLFEIVEEQLEEVELTLNRILKIYLKNQDKYFLEIIKIRVFIYALQIEKFPLNLSEMDFTPLTKDLRSGQEGWQIAMGLRFMAEVYQKQHNFAKAMDYYQKLKAHLIQFLGPEHVEVMALNQYFDNFSKNQEPIGDVSSRSNTNESFINKRYSLQSEGNERLNKYFDSDISVKKILFELGLWETKPGMSDLVMKNISFRRSISSPKKASSKFKQRKVKFSGHRVSLDSK